MQTSTFFKLYMPYCLIPAQHGRHAITNRHYKPLGTTAAVDYDSHPATMHIKGLTEKRIAAIDYRGMPDADGRVYLYADSCLPTSSAAHWQAYQQRLAALSKLAVE